MLNQLKTRFRNDFINLKGWKTNRKLIVIESDDWGSIRVSSKKSVETIVKKGFTSELDPYNRFDALESNDDLNALFEILLSIKDSKGKPAKFTANNIVANPDFDKIEANKFEEYYYEPFTETLKKYPNRENVESLYREGIKEKVFFPQFHGREHLHVNKWMKSLNEGDELMRMLFDNRMFSINTPERTTCKTQYLDAFGVYNEADANFLSTSIGEGVDLFKNIWGYKPESVVSPCHIWDSALESTFKANGLDYIQSGHKQSFPVPKVGEGSKKRHYIGEKNKHDQHFTIRNVIFEPSLDRSKDWVDSCLSEIKSAFYWNKPAIISTHRINFVGELDQNNRNNNLKLLEHLLKQILVKWPEVEFLDSVELGYTIAKK